MSDVDIFGENDLEVIEDGDENEEPTDETPADGDEAPKVVKPKRVIRNPQPKLNAETLQGKRGLTALPSYFERVKFKGHGHEEEDLSVILKTYEYWCHRLFPKLPFDDCIEKIEQLGKKKSVITHIKKIRYDMLCEEPELDNVVDDENDLPDDAFNDLLPDPTPPLPRMEMTEEQLERIRLNKERAERIRMEKMRQKELEQSSQVGSFDDILNETHETLSGRRAIVDSDEYSAGVSEPTDEAGSNNLSKKNDRRRLRVVESDEESFDSLSINDHDRKNMGIEKPSNDIFSSQKSDTQRLRMIDSDEESHEIVSLNDQDKLRDNESMEFETPSNDSFSGQKNDRQRLRIVDSDEESGVSHEALSLNNRDKLRDNETIDFETLPNNSSQKNERRRLPVVDSDDESSEAQSNQVSQSKDEAEFSDDLDKRNSKRRLRTLIDSDED